MTTPVHLTNRGTRLLLPIIVFLFFAVALCASDDTPITGDQTLKQIAYNWGLPTMKLVGHLEGVNPDTLAKDKPIASLGLSPEQVKKGIMSFRQVKMSFGGVLTLIGMVVVFISLFLVQLCIDQLKHFASHAKPGHGQGHGSAATTTVKTEIGKVTAPAPEVSQASIAAVVLAIHMHTADVKEKKQLLLTWSRAPVSMWRAYSKVYTPNNQYYQMKR